MSEASKPEPWLPESYSPPARVELSDGRHLRPIRADDAEIDHPAVMGSRERLWAKYGGPWGWPPATMTLDEDRADLAHHEREIKARESFNYALLDAGETRLLGCVYLDPPGPGDDGDVLVSWWVVEECAGSDVEQELDRFVPSWVVRGWPFRRPVFTP